MANLPGMAGAWLGQYAQIVADRTGERVALVSLNHAETGGPAKVTDEEDWHNAESANESETWSDDESAAAHHPMENGGGELELSLVSPGRGLTSDRPQPRQPQLVSQPRTLNHATSLTQTLKALARDAGGGVGRVLVHLPVPDQMPANLALNDLDRWTLLCGADQAATVAARRLIERLTGVEPQDVQQAQQAQQASKQLNLMVMGANQPRAAAAAAQIARASGQYFANPIELLGSAQKMIPVHIEDIGAFDQPNRQWSELADWLDSASDESAIEIESAEVGADQPAHADDAFDLESSRFGETRAGERLGADQGHHVDFSPPCRHEKCDSAPAANGQGQAPIPPWSWPQTNNQVEPQSSGNGVSVGQVAADHSTAGQSAGYASDNVQARGFDQVMPHGHGDADDADHGDHADRAEQPNKVGRAAGFNGLDQRRYFGPDQRQGYEAGEPERTREPGQAQRRTPPRVSYAQAWTDRQPTSEVRRLSTPWHAAMASHPRRPSSPSASTGNMAAGSEQAVRDSAHQGSSAARSSPTFAAAINPGRDEPIPRLTHLLTTGPSAFDQGGGLVLDARCPHQPLIELMVDGAGRVHLLRRDEPDPAVPWVPAPASANAANGKPSGHIQFNTEANGLGNPAANGLPYANGQVHGSAGHEGSSRTAAGLRAAIMDLIEGRKWVIEHLELLQLTCREQRIDPSAQPMVHLFTDRASLATGLVHRIGADLQLHLLQRIRVGDQLAWFSTPLN